MRVHLVAIAIALVLAGCDSSRRPVTLVVIGRHVITENAQGEVLSPGAVAIDGDTIVEVAAPSDLRPDTPRARSIDASNQIVLPGPDQHAHARARWCSIAAWRTTSR